MLEYIKTPDDIKNLTDEELERLASEIREKIIDTVSANGGHLGSNLGLVEATLAVHRSFDIPTDKLIFDVGHQCYTHKLLTGRYDRFDTLRSDDGISGFTNRFESDYDTFTAGHSGSAISSALGVATADKLAGRDSYTVAVVGDGSFTNGMVYEALNNCNNKNVNLIIILNDNEMSISQNVGSLAEFLSKIRTGKTYYYFKGACYRIFGKIPYFGRVLLKICHVSKELFKRVFYKQPFFEALGVKYLGPVDGNDIDRLSVVLEEAKGAGECVLIHMKTKKGTGYKYAEDKPESYHSVSAFDPDSGIGEGSGNDFSSEFGRILCEKAESDDRVCAITSAMCAGTGLNEFAKRFPSRFFDVGIAEEHEIAFAGGLSAEGFLPVCALYSTFAQRTYDQIIHDLSLQRLHAVIALDRAGFVPGDGETHQGIFDVPFISDIPNTEIYSPDCFDELRSSFDSAFSSNIISVVRYPKGVPGEYDRASFVSKGTFSTCEKFSNGKNDTVVITYGSATANVFRAVEQLAFEGINVKIIKLVKLHPIKEYAENLLCELSGAKRIYFVEEGIKNGGISQKITSELAEKAHLPKILIRAVDACYPTHGSLAYLRRKYGFDSESIACELRTFASDGASAEV